MSAARVGRAVRGGAALPAGPAYWRGLPRSIAPLRARGGRGLAHVSETI